MTLSDGAIGKTYRVREINLETAVKRRFEILGMTVNSAVTVLNKKRRGAEIIKIRGTRFAIGKEFAEGIVVGGESE